MKSSTVVRTMVLSAVVVSFAAGCAGPAKSAGPQVVKRVDKPAPVDNLKVRFETAYFQISCEANRGRDPLYTVMPLEKPTQFLERVENTEGLKHDRAVRILAAQGFAGIRDFLTVELRMKSENEYWQGLQDRFIDELTKCPK